MQKRHWNVRGKHCVVPDSIVFEPWFVPHKITYAIRALLPPEHRLKLQDYFAEWGCMRCGNRERHWSSGFCEKCYSTIHSRLRVCLRRRAELAVLVADQWQKQGLGAELVSRLIEVARDQKFVRVVANILPENQSMLSLANRFGFVVQSSDAAGLVTAELQLT